MALDMDQLRRIFYEECRENLEVLEEMLLTLNPSALDDEDINTVFRAAHSIKGGAATFNLNDITEFTHIAEAYLDKVRNGERQLTKESIDVLLRSSDCIAAMLAGHETNTDVDLSEKTQVANELVALLGNTEASDNNSGEKIPPPNPMESRPSIEPPLSKESCNEGTWNVSFIPHPEIFFSGNDPLRIIREIRDLDPDATIVCESDNVPELEAIESELCYLSWTITVSGKVTESELREVFEWVEDECELTVSKESIKEPSSSNSIDPNPPLNSTSDTSPQNTCEESQAELPSNYKPSNQPRTKSVKADASVSSIRVDIEKVDGLINLVGELVITQSMLTEIGNDFTLDKLDKLKAGLEQLLQNSRDLQENVLNIRMLPMSFAFSRFPRLVRDLSSRLGKQVCLNISGENTELDKTVLERMVDPLVHLVRNCIDHGIESPEKRLNASKSETGTVTLNAYHQGGTIIIEISDDGAGIDCNHLWEKAVQKGVVEVGSRQDELSQQQILNLIFAPGFSTAEQVSDISGRGVGMDVVKRNIEELGGHIEVESEVNKGSRFTINLPLTLSILDGQLVRVADQVFVIPLLSIVESIQIDVSCINHAAGGVELYRLRDENLPILRLQDEFDMGISSSLDGHILCFVESAGRRVGLLIDELLDQQQVVIKSLESNYCKVSGFSGATILGDGSVSLILDIQGMLTSYLERSAFARSQLQISQEAYVS
ncbi:chemotaxis protein CheA [Vibrio sp. D420a]|uniref:chemotaxis protein CheA n=1 Tax=Vibrio sp. D420a TaxID=2836895 RepID=UPI0025533B8B|nr:chemotaxis protein CheA [Vibrio sp. D420a]MDK9761923.1 chemotaxis protein CheA [Vibrio sp. D420a]